MAIEGRLTNVLGIKMPFWIINQLDTRAQMGATDRRGNDELKFISNKSAWVRLVSSINVENGSAHFKYYQTLDPSLTDETDLAKKYVLFGGTSAYENKAYYLRSGFHNVDSRIGGAYGMLGENEIKNYGYRPMPGITRVSIDTMGRLGAIRQATIDIKCWNKEQLDIIDALYFKLGYTMFLEWGHTYYYENLQKENTVGTTAQPVLRSTELFSVDPFQSGLTKEDITRKISQNSRSSDGNYDGMLGLVTNFSFSVNQDGGYDCVLRLMGLGVLGDSIRINNPSRLISLFSDEVLLLSKTLKDLNPGIDDPSQALADQLKAELDEKSSSAAEAQKAYDRAVAAATNPEHPRYNIQSVSYAAPVIFKATDASLFKPANPKAVDLNREYRKKNYSFLYEFEDFGSALYTTGMRGFLPLNQDYIKQTNITIDKTFATHVLGKIFANKKLSSPKNWFASSFVVTNTGAIADNLDDDLLGYHKFTTDPNSELTPRDSDGDALEFVVLTFLPKAIYLTSGNDFDQDLRSIFNATTNNQYRYRPEVVKSSFNYMWSFNVPYFVRNTENRTFTNDIVPQKSGDATTYQSNSEKYFTEIYTDLMVNFDQLSIKSIEDSALDNVLNSNTNLKNSPDNTKYIIGGNQVLRKRVISTEVLANNKRDIPEGFTNGILEVPITANYYYLGPLDGDNLEESMPLVVDEEGNSTTILNIIQNSLSTGQFFDDLEIVGVNVSRGVGYLEEGTTKYTDRIYIAVKSKLNFKIKTLPVKVSNLFDLRASSGGKTTDKTYDTVVNNVDASLDVYMQFTDLTLIKSIDTSAIPNFPVDGSKIKKQVEEQIKSLKDQIAKNQKEAAAALTEQILEALAVQSNLEVTLRTIEVAALNSAINAGGTVDVNIGNTPHKIDLWKSPKTTNRALTDVIFSNGCYEPIINDLIEGKIDDKEYYEGGTDLQKFKVRAKYGFATTLMGSDAQRDEDIFTKLKDKEIDYKELLKAYVIPYRINSDLVAGIQTNHPVYIPLGLLLMILNHSCLLYEDTSPSTANSNNAANFQKPLIYLDYNTKLNFFQTCPQQMSTNPWVTLMRVECDRSEFAEIFDTEVLDNKDLTKAKKIIAPKKSQNQDTNSGNIGQTEIFNPATDDKISNSLPPIKVRGESNNTAYLMNILLNITYLTELVKDNAAKNGTNGVYLKPFLEQILLSVNKYLGDFNAFRLFFSEKANTYQIVDDQCTYTSIDTMTSRIADTTSNTTEIPLMGRFSIAKSLQIKTEMSSKVSNLLAISANPGSEQSQNSVNADSVGFITDGYVDRFIPRRVAASGKLANGEIVASQQFNKTIDDFYSTVQPSRNDVSQATNFLIDKISKVKNKSESIRGTSMIPLGVEFSTDGISGMSMYQTFTVSPNLLPRTYTAVRSSGFLDNQNVYVGFVVTGLTHTIESNIWTTTVRSNMVGVKPPDVFTQKISIPSNTEKLDASSSEVKITPNGNLFYSAMQALNVQFDNRISLEGISKLVGEGDISENLANAVLFIVKSLLTKFPLLKIQGFGGNDSFHRSLGRASAHTEGRGMDFSVQFGTQYRIDYAPNKNASGKPVANTGHANYRRYIELNKYIAELAGTTSGDGPFASFNLSKLAAQYNVNQFLDEGIEGSKESTGPHWHISVSR